MSSRNEKVPTQREIDSAAVTSSSTNGAKTTKRLTCHRCHRPTKVCICKALPQSRVNLNKSEVVVLQHPHESRRKNRSLPLVELCVDPQDMHVAVARRFGSHVDASIMALWHNESDRNVILVYPSEDAVSLSEGLKILKERQSEKQHADKTVLVFLDATWKYAREMHKANVSNNQLPANTIHVKLTVQDWNMFSRARNFKPARFEIRTPPSPDHLSTAECIAWVLSTIEDDPSIYDVLMKPLDLMVEQWRSLSGNSQGTFSFTNGDGNMIGGTKQQAASRGQKRKK